MSEPIELLSSGTKHNRIAMSNHSSPGNRAIIASVIARALDVMGDDIRQPDPVIGDARAYPPPRFGQPPVLYVALHELARGRMQQMLAQ